MVTLNFISKSLFLVHHLVVISVATDDDSAGDVRESNHLMRCAKLMYFFFIFVLLVYLSLCWFFFIFGWLE